MNLRDPQQSLEIMRKARGSKGKYFLFCLMGAVVGLALLFIPYHRPLVDFFPWVTPAVVQITGFVLTTVYGVLVLFFGLSLFTRIWEGICDWNIAKIQARIHGLNAAETGKGFIQK